MYNDGPDDILDGDSGYGFGIDIGYRLGHGFALEYDFSYARNTVTETDGEDCGRELKHRTIHMQLDLVYTYEFTETLGVFVKAGYEYEIEGIDEYDIDVDEDGFNYGIGVELSIES